MQNNREQKLSPVHISQAFGISTKESDLDFFDANLHYDSRLFIDPFLLKRSPVAEEKEVFRRFGRFFKHAYEQSLKVGENVQEIEKLKSFLSFYEPKEINLGYTKESNIGSGLGPLFASSLFHFFLSSSATRIIVEDDLYPDEEFNPATLAIFTDGLGYDGISDLTANLIMDYLIEYTQRQCRKWGIKLKNLPVRQSFDFEEMEWTNGFYANLPENPMRSGEPIVFIPKHLLRAEETITHEKVKSKVIGILREDPNLKSRFSILVLKKIQEIDIKEIRSILLNYKSVFQKYLQLLEREDIKSYEFEVDILEILAIKKYHDYFKKKKIESKLESCKDLLKHTQDLIKEFKKELSMRDGWKDMWCLDNKRRLKPNKEIVFGRKFRGMGYAYFRWLPVVTFDAEIGTGAGVLDFRVIHQDCRIAIELKLLRNSASTGKPSLKAYIHGIKRQLPQYTILSEAKYAFYITGQHYHETEGKKPKNHTDRANEIRQLVPEVEKSIKAQISEFKELFYENIDLSPRLSASKI